MRPKGAKALLALVCILLAFTCAVLTAVHYEKRLALLTLRYRYECPSHLQDLWGVAMALGRQDDRLPQDLTSVAAKVPIISRQNIYLRLSPILCPGSETPFHRNKPAAEASDYTYINWSSAFAHMADIPPEYPLAYDRKLANHLQRGIFVLRVDGSVMWDRGAEWIREFSKRHPDYHVLVPE